MRKLDLLERSLRKIKQTEAANQMLFIKKAYFVNDMASLRKYLTNREGRGLEVVELNRDAFFRWLDEKINGTDEEDYSWVRKKNNLSQDDIPLFIRETINEWIEEPYDVDLSKIPEKILEKYLLDGSWRDSIDDVFAPSWDCMSFEKVLRNEWLIHFNKKSYSIARDGFKYGIDDLTHLCLTTHLSDAAKQYGGFNFAYPISYGKAFSSGPNYGNQAVIFRANGIMVFHHGDDEYQVIFAGSTARDIIPIINSNEQWFAGDYEKGFDDLRQLANWVDNNFQQYHRLLIPR
jgi:hypothetical protein